MKKCILGLLLFCSCTTSPHQAEPLSLYDPTPFPLPVPQGFPPLSITQEQWPTRAEVYLGERLFHDALLSADGTISCASCHLRQKAFAHPAPRAIGVKGRVGLRNAPALQNLAFMQQYMWDGAVVSLTRQAIIPIVSHDEMDTSLLHILEKLRKEPSYVELFQKAFANGQINGENLLRSFESYMYSLVSAQSKYDSVMQGKASFTPIEKQGYEVFERKCQSCHSGSLFSDEQFHNIGFPPHPNTLEEQGRARVTGSAADKGKFRTPSLRNVALTAPYGSHGQFATLAQVLAFFNNGVHISPTLSPLFQEQAGRIPLTDNEQEALLAFMKTLSDTTYVH